MSRTRFAGAAAVVIIAQIRRVAQELVDQIAVGTMELHAIEPGTLGVFSCVAIARRQGAASRPAAVAGR